MDQITPQGNLDREDATQVAELFKVLGDPTRVLILQALIRNKELCVRHLAETVEMSQSAVSHHLRVLRTARLIRFRREGREVYYRPDDEHVEQLILVCSEHIRHESAGGGADGAAETGLDSHPQASVGAAALNGEG
ncbi:MAG: hypothetical protein Kow00129_15930 [Thermoleophilia bacterium]